MAAILLGWSALSAESESVGALIQGMRGGDSMCLFTEKSYQLYQNV